MTTEGNDPRNQKTTFIMTPQGADAVAKILARGAVPTKTEALNRAAVAYEFWTGMAAQGWETYMRHPDGRETRVVFL